MDLRINVEFEYLLESCLYEAQRRVDAYNEFEEKHVSFDEIIIFSILDPVKILPDTTFVDIFIVEIVQP